MKDRSKSRYHGHRFPAEVIAHTVWLYFRFPLSLRMVEDLLATRGIVVSHETVRRWGERFGRDFANTIRRRTARLGDKWHLDEVVVTINGKPHWLWRAVGQDGFVLDALVQSRRIDHVAKMLNEDPELLQAIVYNDDNLTCDNIISVHTEWTKQSSPLPTTASTNLV